MGTILLETTDAGGSAEKPLGNVGGVRCRFVLK
jgi:hypothetical protein